LEDLFQEGHVKRGLVALGRDAPLARLPLEQPQGQAAQQGDVLPAVAAADAAGTFAEHDIQLPV
jgi:hypothetical protein